MQTTSLLLLFPVILAMGAAVIYRPRAAGWILLGFGLVFLAHAGATLIIIWSNGGVVPDGRWMNYYMLFATIPAGVVLVLSGSLMLIVACCRARGRTRSS
jgi:hypothetical protein